MNGTILPKFLEGQNLPKGYFQPQNPYENVPSCHVDLGALTRYAKEKGKKLFDLKKEEVQKFSI